MHTVDIFRHARKIEGEPHGKGVEAGLETEGIEEDIESFLQERIKIVESADRIRIITSPVGRSKQTAQLIHKQISKSHKCQTLLDPQVTPLAGSYDEHEGEVINLGPREMSRIWGEAKSGDLYTAVERREDNPLAAWAHVGFDNTWEETGISIREIALRIGTLLYQIFSDVDDANTYDMIISHSGDIEPFLYLLLAMIEGKDTHKQNIMPEMLKRTGGALNPLEGIRILQKDSDTLELSYDIRGKSESIVFPISILGEMAEEYKRISIAERVFDKKISGEAD